MNPPSNKEKKRIVSEGLRRLQQKPGWDPTRRDDRPDPAQKLTSLADESRRDRTYSQADACGDCEAARAETGDETALCEPHLMEAMGL